MPSFWVFELLLTRKSITNKIPAGKFLPAMYRQKKQLTAEEAPRVGSKIQKKNEKNKQAVTQTKVERMATRLRFNSTESTPNQTSTNKNNAGQTPKQVEWEVEDALAGWPWVGVPAKLLTQAPYALNEHNVETGFFKLPQEVQVV